MNKDKIIEMARQAGMEVHSSKGQIRIGSAVFTGDDTTKQVVAFAKLVALRYEKRIADLENIIAQRHWNVLQEREACAKVCGRLADEALVVGDEDAVMCFEEAENAIRARGEA